MLIVTTDRLSAFDVILPDPISGKGEVLTQISNFWFDFSKDIIPNHLSTDLTLEEVLMNPDMRAELGSRAIVVKKLIPLPIEAISRGYIIGSGWKDYQKTGKICGIDLPANLSLAEKIPDGAIYTPSTKADLGSHDENISFKETIDILFDFLCSIYDTGSNEDEAISEKAEELATSVRDISLLLYIKASKYALDRGIIIADTKFEFGLDENGNLVLSDEVLTPDSSRFWSLSKYKVGESPESFDKQFIRDYLETLDWNKKAPAPNIPEKILNKTAEKYREAEKILTTYI